MKYLLLITVDPSIEPDEAPGEIEAWLERLGDSRLIGDGLLAPSTAKTVRMRKNERLITDGPFVETKEFIAGFDVIECDSLEGGGQGRGAGRRREAGAAAVRPCPGRAGGALLR